MSARSEFCFSNVTGYLSFVNAIGAAISGYGPPSPVLLGTTQLDDGTGKQK
jgi:hypothetical protein